MTGFDPADTALVTNTTVTTTGAAGFLTVFPDDAPNIPLAVDITWAPQQTIGNLVVANLGSTAAFDVFNGSTGSTDVVIDVQGFYRASPPAGRILQGSRIDVTDGRAANHPSAQVTPTDPVGCGGGSGSIVTGVSCGAETLLH